MKSTNKTAIEAILIKLDTYQNELAEIQEEESSESIDQALDDLAMVIEELNSAMEE